MTSSTSFLNRLAIAAAVFAALAAGCGHGPALKGPTAQWKDAPIAVLPVENLSATSAPLKDIRQTFIDKMKARGMDVLPETALEDFMARHRVRYTGGIDAATAAQFKDETGAAAVLITSLELYNTYNPPKVGVASRLVRTGADPGILWIDSASMAGDDHPGLLELGLLEDPKAVTDRVLGILAGSLSAYMSGQPPALEAGAGRYRPKFYFKSPVLSPDVKYKVAVVPFFNKSERRNAGDIMMLAFIRGLSDVPGMTVMEPGVVRDDLLRLRVVMEEGLTLDTAEVVMNTLGVDLLVMGSVLDYEDYQGVFGMPKVDFTVQVLEKKSMQIVWESKSYNTGDDGVFFFDWHRINTAGQMTSQMVDNVVRMMTEP
jgi:hypothetical protein